MVPAMTWEFARQCVVQHRAQREVEERRGQRRKTGREGLFPDTRGGLQLVIERVGHARSDRHDQSRCERSNLIEVMGISMKGPDENLDRSKPIVQWS